MKKILDVYSGVAKIWRENVWLRYGVVVLCLMIAVVPIILSVVNPVYNVDSLVLLEESERISEGWMPYAQMHLNYPPLWFYLMAGLELLFGWKGAMCYPYYVIVHYFFVLGCAWLVYCIVRYIGIWRIYAVLGGWLFLIMSHWMYGNSPLLPIPSVFFGLVSCAIILQKNLNGLIKYVFVGLFSCASFLTKQYGIGFLFLDLLLIVCLSRSKLWLQILFYLIGYTLPLLFSYLIWNDAIVHSVLFNGFSTNGEPLNETFSIVKYTIGSLIIVEMMIYFLLRCAPFVLLFVLLKKKICERRLVPILIFCVFAIWLFFECCGIIYTKDMDTMIPLSDLYSTIKKNHLYVVPFISILFAIMCSMLDYTKGWKKGVVVFFLTITIFSSIWGTYRNRLVKGYLSDNRFEETRRLPWEQIGDFVPTQASLFMVSVPDYFFLPDSMAYLPPNMKKTGYSCGGLETTVEQLYQNYSTADFLVFRTSDYWFWKSLYDADSLAENFVNVEYRMMRNDANYPTDTIAYPNGFWIVIDLRKKKD